MKKLATNNKLNYNKLCGGTFSKPPISMSLFHGSVDNSNYSDMQEFNTGVDINNPYHVSDGEMNFETNTKKKNVISVEKTYAEFTEFTSPNAFASERYEDKHNTETYCDRKPHYPQHFSHIYRVMSYNVHNWVKQCTDGMNKGDVRKNIKFALDVVEKINPDIVFLQEVVPIHETKPVTDEEIEKGNFTLLVETMQKMDYEYYIIGDTHHTGEESVRDAAYPYFLLCNAIFSKYPIRSKKVVVLGGNRAAVCCVVEYPNNTYVAYYNVHLEYSKRQQHQVIDNGNEITVTYPQSQVNVLGNLIYNDSIIFDKEYPNIVYVLGGDFNTSIKQKSSFDFSPILQNLNLVKSKLSVESDDNMHKITASNRHKILDYFFVCNNTNVVDNKYLIIPSPNSDHYPIMMDLKF